MSLENLVVPKIKVLKKERKRKSMELIKRTQEPTRESSQSHSWNNLSWNNYEINNASIGL